ncbi:hypothetical protein [Streptomyces sioyaensis]|uniref:hypothetical protein n=1 Tax=Streptomyces sioyaensis TaxID=67364 RepID=UPI00379D0789
MNQPITPERLAEIREREQEATKGPWGTYYDGKGTYTVQSVCCVSLATGFTSDGDIATLNGEHGDGQAYANADFIARAREDVRALLAEVDRLRAYAEAQQAAYQRLDERISQIDIRESPEAWDLAASVVAILTGPPLPAPADTTQPTPK